MPFRQNISSIVVKKMLLTVLFVNSFLFVYSQNITLVTDPALTYAVDESRYEGESFTRKYTITNTSGSAFSGRIRFSDNFGVALNVTNLSFTTNSGATLVANWLDAGGVTITGSDFPTAIASGNNFVLKISDFKTDEQITFIEKIQVTGCLSGGVGKTEVVIAALNTNTNVWDPVGGNFVTDVGSGTQINILDRLITTPLTQADLLVTRSATTPVAGLRPRPNCTYSGTGTTGLRHFSYTVVKNAADNSTLKNLQLFLAVSQTDMTVISKSSIRIVKITNGTSETLNVSDIIQANLSSGRDSSSCLGSDDDFENLVLNLGQITDEISFTIDFDEYYCCENKYFKAYENYDWSMYFKYDHDCGVRIQSDGFGERGYTKRIEYNGFYTQRPLSIFGPRPGTQPQTANLIYYNKLNANGYEFFGPQADEGFVYSPDNARLIVVLKYEQGLNYTAYDAAASKTLAGAWYDFEKVTNPAGPYLTYPNLHYRSRDNSSLQWHPINPDGTLPTGMSYTFPASPGYKNNQTKTFVFNLNEFPGFNGPQATYGVKNTLYNYLTSSNLVYTLESECPPNAGKSHYKLDFYFVPDITCPSDCVLPLSTNTEDVQINCPGCQFPGGAGDFCTLERTTLGLADADNDRLPDNGNAVDPNVNTDTNLDNDIRLDIGIIGDEVRFHTQYYLTDGGQACIGSSGNGASGPSDVTFGDLKFSYLDVTFPFGQDFTLLSKNNRDMRVSIHHSGGITDYYIPQNQFSSLVTVEAVPLSRNSSYFFDCSLIKLAPYLVSGTPAPPGSYHSHDRIEIEFFLTVTTNETSGNPVAEIALSLQPSFSATEQFKENLRKPIGVGTVADQLYCVNDPANPNDGKYSNWLTNPVWNSNFDNTKAYICEGYYGSFNLAEVNEQLTYFTNTFGNQCNQGIGYSNTYTAIGKDIDNLFINEYRPSPLLDTIQIAVPDGWTFGGLGYGGEPTEISSYITYVKGGIVTSKQVYYHLDQSVLDDKVNPVPRHKVGNFTIYDLPINYQQVTESNINSIPENGNQLIGGDERTNYFYWLGYVADCNNLTLDQTPLALNNTLDKNTLIFKGLGGIYEKREVIDLNNNFLGRPKATLELRGFGAGKNISVSDRNYEEDFQLVNIPSSLSQAQNIFIGVVPDANTIQFLNGLPQIYDANGVLLPETTSGSGIYKVNNLNIGSGMSFKIKSTDALGSFKNCNENSSFNLNLVYGWDCNRYPTDLSSASLSSICNFLNDAVKLNTDVATWEALPIVTAQPNCDEIIYAYTVKALEGGIDNVKFNLTFDNGVDLKANSLSISYGNLLFTKDTDYSFAPVIGSPGVYQVVLNNLSLTPPFKSDKYNLPHTDHITLNFTSALQNCSFANNSDGVVIEANATSFCNRQLPTMRKDKLTSLTYNECIPCSTSCSLTIDAGTDLTFCRSQVGSIPLNVSVAGSSNVSYLWLPGGETTQTINVSPVATTTYSVTVTDKANIHCSKTDNVTITVNQGPQIGLRVDDPLTTDPNDPSLLCPGQSVDLIATAGYSSYVWTDGSTTLPETASTISVTTAGNYTVTVTDGNGCSNTAVVPVVTKPELQGDGEMCEGQTPSLYVNLFGAICNNCHPEILKDGGIYPGAGGYNYQNFKGAIPLAACTLYTDPFPVKVKPNPAKPIITPGFTLLCPNDPVSIPLTIPNIGAIANMTSYSWSTGVSGVNTITAKSAGRYTVTVLADGCTSEGYAEIVVPEIYLYQQCIDANNIILHAGYNMAGSGFVWTDGQGNVLTPTDPADPSRMTVSTGGVYTVTIINPVCGAITASISPSFVSPGANIGVNMVDNGDFANSITPAVYPAVQIPYQCPANPVISDLSCVNVPFSGYNQMVGNYTVTFMDAGNWNHGLWNGTGYIVTPGNPTERNFLLADGAVTTLTQRVWYTTVHNVTLGSRYHYRALVNNVINVEGQVPLVSLQIGAKTNMSKQTIYANQPRWVELSGEWIADVSGDVEIAVLLAPGGVIGRDIGVDEIAFEEIVCDASDYGRPCLAKVNVGPDKYVCPGLPIEIGANVVVAGSGLQYAWATSDAPAITFSTDANPIVNLSATTSYTLTVTDPLNNCKAIDNVTVHSITPNMVVTAMASPAAVCSDGITHLNATVAGTGNYAYTWSPAAGLTPSASVQNPTAVIRAKTIFTVTATDLIGCFASGNVTVDMANFNVSISPSMPVITCVPATISASGGVSWLWSDGSTTQSISTNNPGNYSVTATDANGCIATASVTIVVLPPAAPNITPGGPTTFCTGGSVTLTSNPGASYSWSDGSTTQSITVNTSGTYSVIITDQFGCLSTASISVTVNPLPGVPTVITPVTYCQNATATALLAGGSSLKWYSSPTGGTGSSTSPTPITTAAGTTNYYVSQTANNCEGARAVIAVIVNPLPSAPTVTSPVNYCQNATASALTAIGTNLKWYTAASGGTGSPTAPTPLTTTVGTTTYYVSQTVSGCESARASIDVIINAIPAAPVVTSPVTYCRNATAAPLTATGANLKWYTVASGGTGSSTALTPVTTASGTTIYYVSQTINGCESAKAQISVVVTSTVTPTPVVTTPVTYCQNDAASPLSATGSSLLWYTSASGGAGSSTAPTPVTTSAGTTLYYVSQTKNGCESARVLITVNVNPLPPATITASGSTNISNGGSVKLSVPTGTAYSYKWFNGTSKVGAASSYTATTAGNYTVEVTDGATGCKATSSVTTVTTSTGIHSLSAIDAFSKIYPNPVSKEITIETNLHLATASLKLLDAFGSEVSVSVSVNGTDAHVDVSFLPDGIYTLLITEDNYIIRKKIIVIH
jgi:hypothetical protein